MDDAEAHQGKPKRKQRICLYTIIVTTMVVFLICIACNILMLFPFPRTCRIDSIEDRIVLIQDLQETIDYLQKENDGDRLPYFEQTCIILAIQKYWMDKGELPKSNQDIMCTLEKLDLKLIYLTDFQYEVADQEYRVEITPGYTMIKGN